MTSLHQPVAEPGVFAADDPDGAGEHFEATGYVVVRGILDEAATAEVEAECIAAQDRLVAGDLDGRHGNTELVDDVNGTRTARFANYVTHVQELSSAAAAAAHHPTSMDLLARWLGQPWLGDERHGVVYQDARPGAGSSYSRIGWHSDWQSGPHLTVWPSVAFTIHIDGTSPANGFLRVAPGSHLWATPAPWSNVNGAAVPDGSTPWGGHGDAAPPVPMPSASRRSPVTWPSTPSGVT